MNNRHRPDKRDRKLSRTRREAMNRIGLASVSPMAGETSLCIAYMCPWAHSCPSAAPRMALVPQRSCIRMYPAENRPATGLSGYALDLLADLRDNGSVLSPATTAILDEFRPSGPSRSFYQRRPALPLPAYVT